MNTPQDSSLGRSVAYPAQYDPSLLYPIPRADSRATLGLAAGAALPFVGHDRWHAYELGWLDGRGKPVVATATLQVPANSPHLVESKSLKLYLNSLNASRFAHPDEVRATIATDLSATAGATVDVAFGLPDWAAPAEGVCDLDGLDVAIDSYGPPDSGLLHCRDEAPGPQAYRSALLKSNCPVTGQPDWATVHIALDGPRLDPAGLLRYLVSFRDHAEFHEHCVERIFLDLSRATGGASLMVEARYTRRGGLDINPWRGTPDRTAPPPARERQQ